MTQSPDYLANLKKSDVLFLSGSGRSVYKFQQGEEEAKYAEPLRKTQEVVRDLLGEGKWVFGGCYGGQAAMLAVGGQIGRLPEGVTEAGWLSQTLTPAGEKDEVFGFLPPTFYAPHFHNDYVKRLPVVGSVVETASGPIRVRSSEVLATRRFYLDRTGDHPHQGGFIMASVITFENGARLYQVQAHPEMATAQYANFLVRMNPWLRDEMGEAYYLKALEVFTDADYSVAKLIPSFIREAKKQIDARRQFDVVSTASVQNLFRYMLP